MLLMFPDLLDTTSSYTLSHWRDEGHKTHLLINKLLQCKKPEELLSSCLLLPAHCSRGTSETAASTITLPKHTGHRTSGTSPNHTSVWVYLTVELSKYFLCRPIYVCHVECCQSSVDIGLHFLDWREKVTASVLQLQITSSTTTTTTTRKWRKNVIGTNNNTNMNNTTTNNNGRRMMQRQEKYVLLWTRSLLTNSQGLRGNK